MSCRRYGLLPSLTLALRADGLYASVWTQDIDRAVRVARKLEAGTVGVNATSPSTANELVFGGYKQSGWAREGGVNSLHLWTQQKSVVIKYKNAA